MQYKFVPLQCTCGSRLLSTVRKPEMRKLIKTRDGAYLMRSQILSVRGRRKGEVCRVVAADGDTYVIYPSSILI